MKKYLIVLIAVYLAGCGANYRLNQARDLERKGYFVEACLKYETFYKDNPGSALAPVALYRLARIYQSQLKLYSQSTQYFLELAQKYPRAVPWAERAMRGAMRSPDYFPLSAGSFWIEGDSETGGGNMRAEWNCLEVSSTTRCIQRRIYAGKMVVSTVKHYYDLVSFEVRESNSASLEPHTVIMAYPYFEGKTWKAVRDGNPTVYTIMSKTVTVKTKAGEFINCLKIREINLLIPGSQKFNYYAPDIGWVLTTTGSAGGREHANTELLSCKIVRDTIEENQ
jgi:tetratricopeptide (TPR) repeat protein